ncbi:MAG: sensor histidine kinase [Gammaproteobacteria bacterium]
MQASNDKNEIFLPNFCAIRTIFLVVMIGQLFAFIMVLVPITPSTHDIWNNLSLVSLFVQWIGLSSCAIICIIRPKLTRFSHLTASLIVYILLLIILGFVSEGAYWLVYPINSFNYPDWHSTYIIRNLTIGAIIFAIALRYFYVQHQWAQKIKTESHARLEALQSRIRPHFLFNSLNTIASLTRIDPERAETATEDLADLFRATLKDAHTRIAIKTEFDLCRRYLNIEKLRMGERLEVQWQIDDIPGDALIPPLTLQPIVENAIYHGVENNIDRSVIKIIGVIKNKTITITISNPVTNDAKIDSGNKNKHKGNHMAMENIKQRLAVYYGTQQSVSIEEDFDNQQYLVHIQFPYINTDESA